MSRARSELGGRGRAAAMRAGSGGGWAAHLHRGRRQLLVSGPGRCRGGWCLWIFMPLLRHRQPRTLAALRASERAWRARAGPRRADRAAWAGGRTGGAASGGSCCSAMLASAGVTGGAVCSCDIGSGEVRQACALPSELGGLGQPRWARAACSREGGAPASRPPAVTARAPSSTVHEEGEREPAAAGIAVA
eukprot:7391647-Prymnesium_polylepis.1